MYSTQLLHMGRVISEVSDQVSNYKRQRIENLIDSDKQMINCQSILN